MINTFSCVKRDKNLNSISLTKRAKVPQLRSLVQRGGIPGVPGQIGEIVLNRGNKTFYGYTGKKWVPFNGASSANLDDGFQASNEFSVVITDNSAAGIMTVGGSAAGGLGAKATGENSVAIGRLSQATSLNAVAVGVSSYASNQNTVAIGSSSEASNFGSVAVGSSSEASGVDSTAIGIFSEASADGTIAIGNATASALKSIAVGTSSDATQPGSIALGPDAVTSATAKFAVNGLPPSDNQNIYPVTPDPTHVWQVKINGEYYMIHMTKNTTCTGDQDCPPGYICGVDGVCIPPIL